MLDVAPRRRVSLPWADLILFIVIAGVLALWWLRAPDAPDTWLSNQNQPQSNGAEVTRIAFVDGAPPTATPTRRPTLPPPTPTITPQPTPAESASPVRHKVVSGDTVAGIAQTYGSTIKDIIESNGLSANGMLRVGQELIVPVAGPSGGPGPTATPQGEALMYIVKSGDTISDIADRYKSRIDWILTANNLKATDFLRVGQSLLVPLMPTTPTATPTPIVTPTTPTPTLEPALAAPALLSPADGSVLSGQSEVALTWMSAGMLDVDEWYVVTLRAGDQSGIAGVWWTKTTTWRLPAEYRGASRAGVDFIWKVQVRRVIDGQVGPAVSPSSTERRFTWR